MVPGNKQVFLYLPFINNHVSILNKYLLDEYMNLSDSTLA